MTRRVFLHIGAMKTGTTSLQQHLSANKKALRQMGILWPGRTWQDQSSAFGDLLKSARAMPGREGAWQRLKRELRPWDGDVLMSMELLAARGPGRIRRVVRQLGQDAEVHVILTVRDLARAIPSQWQEHAQNGGSVPWAEYVDAVCSDQDHPPKCAKQFWRHQEAAQIVRKWSQFVPLERIHVVTLPGSGGDPSLLWTRFASVVGISEQALPAPGRGRNTSLGTVSAELMRRVSAEIEGIDWPHYRLGFKSGLAKRTLAEHARDESRLVLPERHHDWVRARSRRLIKELEELSPHIVGDLEDLMPAAELPREHFDPGESTDAELLEVALAGLVGLGRQLGDARLELARLKRRRQASAGPRQPAAAKRAPSAASGSVRARQRVRRAVGRWSRRAGVR
jgi:hypothetical protein